ncbi:MAG: HAD family hydrolase [Zetaproteobacteria bacterium]|nr:MAG: HAD family hydrolase [Zetaproteobacteria bacterium]
MSEKDNIQLPDAVFWDWDGTLVDSYGFLNDAHSHTLITLGFEPFKKGEYKQYFGKPREMLYPAIYNEKCEEAKEIFGKYVAENSHKIQTIQGGERVLKFLYRRNIKMGIVSNKKASFIALELKHLGWEKYFSVIVGAGDAHTDKPSPAPLLLALENSGIDKDYTNIWYIGDTENDLACAQSAGCASLFLSGVAETETLLQKYNPIITFDNYSQLEEILVAI